MRVSILSEMTCVYIIIRHHEMNIMKRRNLAVWAAVGSMQEIIVRRTMLLTGAVMAS